MERHRPSLANKAGPALAATSTWGSKSQPAQAPEATQPTPTDHFPALREAALRPRTSSRPRQRIDAPPPPHYMQTPPRQQDQEAITMSDLMDMF
ncbi:hypothetical protein E2C01_033011 [Portunus trituberculatus]|uniref:Uncharacterized protein n=1 Tax=Portunus trituberculatus TaxID=210409 RepID=A0A5B7F4H8_PORTR|nr:hypothetical protein [Portunus trituberculatus]